MKNALIITKSGNLEPSLKPRANLEAEGQAEENHSSLLESFISKPRAGRPAGIKKGEAKKTKKICFRCSPEQQTRWKAKAQAEGMSFSQLVELKLES